jgi:BMFP domain-containing protein YqiC
MIRRFIAWLSKRFPVQLVVTREEYDRLDAAIAGLSNALTDLNRRLGALETQVRRLNESQGFSPLVKGGGVRLER